MATVSMKCPNCGGELIFDPKSQKYKCEYCGSDFALDEISTEEAATQAVSDVVQEREDTADNHTQQSMRKLFREIWIRWKCLM